MGKPFILKLSFLTFMSAPRCLVLVHGLGTWSKSENSAFVWSFIWNFKTW